MHPKPETIFQVLAEGSCLSILRITVNGQQRYLTDHHEHDFTDEGLGVNRQIGYGSFEEAFMYISKYPWHRLYLHTVHEDYRVQVLELLMEQLNRDRVKDKYYRGRKLYEHEKALGASICQDATGKWIYTLGDLGPSKPVIFDKGK